MVLRSPAEIDSPYRSEASPKVREVLEKLTEPRAWDEQRFRAVLAAEAVAGEYLPAPNRPDSIDLGRLNKHVEFVRGKTAETGHEWWRGLLVDIDKGIVVQGRTVSGDARGVQEDWSEQPGRERVQRRSICVHGHRLDIAPVAHGLSHGDYSNLLGDPEEVGAIMTFGEYTFMVLKTSVTVNNLSTERIDQLLQDIAEHIAESSPPQKFVIERVVNYNKQVCVEFGLTLYIGGEDGKLERRQVV